MAFRPAQVGQAGAHQTNVIDPTMVIKAGIFNGQDRVLHDLRDVFEFGVVAPLFAKLAYQGALDRVHPHGQFGPVIGQVRDVWQLWICHGQGQGDQQ